MKHPAVAITALLLTAAASAAPPTISFDKDTVTATGITPRGRAACYGVAHDFRAVHPELLRWAREATDDDGDGSVSFQIPREVPRDSQWFVVDLATGQLSADTPRGDEPREVAFAGGIATDAKNNPRAAFRVERGMMDFFAVRPGIGSWVSLTGDGAIGDGDGQSDGAISAEFRAFNPVGKSPAAPAAFEQSDLIVAIDPLTLEYAVISARQR